MVSKDFFIRDLEADTFRENFLVSAVVSLLVIRLFLELTNYPILGGGNFHIAHMLWGGFFMVAALFILLSFLNKSAAYMASILGGIGFGMFIDELGKFITKENDYFFEPTIAFIYIIFVLLYLISRFIPRYRKISKKEYLINALEMVKESAINDFDEEEEKRAKAYLNKADPKDITVQALKKLLARVDATPTPAPNIFTRFRTQLRDSYTAIARSGIILNIVILFLAVQTIRNLYQAGSLLIVRPVLEFNEWGILYSSLLAGAFVLIGLFALRFSKRESYRFFRIALLITILLTEFFSFMRTQWLELFSLFANTFMLVVINYAMLVEREKSKTGNNKE